MFHILRPLGRRAIAAGFAAALAVSASGQASVQADPLNSGTAVAKLTRSMSRPATAGIDADIHLLSHTMPGVLGRPVPATTLLFTPKGQPPADGWPIVGWIHGTSTPGQNTCAPSLTPELDGGLTHDGFKSDYAWQIGQFVAAGYAVVAPDLEGLGPDATSNYPYYDLSSLARSLVAGVVAARQAEPRLSKRWAVVGHSDGGHGALGVEGHASEAAGLDFVGTVASVPYVAIEAHAARFGADSEEATTEAAARQGQMMQQFQGALMTTGLSVEQPGFKPKSIMGPDLAATLPRFRSLCSVAAIGVIDAAVKARGKAFRGLAPGWAAQPQMQAFLAANDPAVAPRFTLHKPVLVVQGTADTFVLEAIQTGFVGQIRQRGAPVRYQRYPGADHFTIIRRANADVLAFLRERFAR